MKKNLTMKIFSNNLTKNIKTIALKPKLGLTGNMKYFPSFSKEWRNIIYSFNKNNLKNLPVNDMNINKIIKSYFDLFFKSNTYLSFTKFSPLKRRRNFLTKIFVSDAEIKHTNNKAKITLYTINREKKVLKTKYVKLYKRLSLNLFTRYIFLYRNYIKSIYIFLHENLKVRNESFFESDLISKKNYVEHKLDYLRIFLRLNNLLLKKIWTELVKNQSKNYINLLRKYNFLYSLNQFKFNKLILLPKLSSILRKIIGKKIEYNIINLKSISYNTDLFTKILALRIKKIKGGHLWKMLTIINKAYLPQVNTIQERMRVQSRDDIDPFLNKYRDLKVVSNINQGNGLSKVFNTIFDNTSSKNNQKKDLINYGNDSKKIHNLVYNSIGYKNISGIKIEVKGRLTKRYRADRAIYTLKWKGGLKNIDSSFKGLSSVLFRGNSNSNVSYSWAKSKRRVGSFAVKGWIGGK